MTNPAPPKILKVLQKFCCGFAEQQNRSKTDQLPQGNEQNSICPVSVYKYYNPAKRNFAKGAQFLLTFCVQDFFCSDFPVYL